MPVFAWPPSLRGSLKLHSVGADEQRKCTMENWQHNITKILCVLLKMEEIQDFHTAFFRIISKVLWGCTTMGSKNLGGYIWLNECIPSILSNTWSSGFRQTCLVLIPSSQRPGGMSHKPGYPPRVHLDQFLLVTLGWNSGEFYNGL